MSKGSGPPNFRTMRFPPSRYGTPSVPATIVKTIKQIDPFKNYLNSLRCPVCGSQIEGISEPFFCVANNEHYRLYLQESLPYTPSHEIVVIYDDNSRRYAISQDVDSTKIVVSYENSPTKEPITFSFRVFDFLNTTKEKILNKLKTIMVFQ